jgi:hypothetical protein
VGTLRPRHPFQRPAPRCLVPPRPLVPPSLALRSRLQPRWTCQGSRQ